MGGNEAFETYDLVIIGGGVGGLVTASGAAQFGAKVCLIEKEKDLDPPLGGDCLHHGCVPTKALLHYGKRYNTLNKAYADGLLSEKPQVDFNKAREHMLRSKKTLSVHDEPKRFEDMGVRVILGSGEFTSPDTFKVNDEEIKGKRFLIATGSSPHIPPLKGMDQVDPLTNVTALQLTTLPESIIILGAGPIGVEFAQIFSSLGVKVRLLKRSPLILSKEDSELSQKLEDTLVSSGIEIITYKKIEDITKSKDGVTVTTIINGESININGERLMAASGRRPNVEGLNLEAAHVEYNKEFGIMINDKLQTTNKKIYSCGDVCGPYNFTHLAEYQAGIVIGNALFPFKRKADYRVVPWVTYTNPELARVGLTEAEAIELYGKEKLRVFTVDLKETDRGVTDDIEIGMIKIIVNKQNRIIGAHVLSPIAGELIGEFVLAMRKNLPITDISQTIHSYPTFSLALKRTTDQYYGETLFKGSFPKIAKFMIEKLLR